MRGERIPIVGPSNVSPRAGTWPSSVQRLSSYIVGARRRLNKVGRRPGPGPPACPNVAVIRHDAAAHEVVGDLVVVEPTAVATGGDGLSRQSGGRVVLVEGALPGEQVEARVTEVRRGYARAITARVLRAAPERVSPPCPWVAAGCGGCGWQH